MTVQMMYPWDDFHHTVDNHLSDKREAKEAETTYGAQRNPTATST
jgi:hypothetical protein